MLDFHLWIYYNNLVPLVQKTGRSRNHLQDITFYTNICVLECLRDFFLILYLTLLSLCSNTFVQWFISQLSHILEMGVQTAHNTQEIFAISIVSVPFSSRYTITPHTYHVFSFFKLREKSSTSKIELTLRNNDKTKPN